MHTDTREAARQHPMTADGHVYAPDTHTNSQVYMLTHQIVTDAVSRDTHTHPHTQTRVCTQTYIHSVQTHIQSQEYLHRHACMYVTHRCTSTCFGTPRGHTQTSADTRPHRHAVCRAHLGTRSWALAHACLHASVRLTGPTARQPPPPIHLSVDCGQQAGREPGSGGWESGSIGQSLHQAGERRRPMTLDAWGGRALPCSRMRS